jgi:hypothetical protein
MPGVSNGRMASNELDEPQKVSGFGAVGTLWDRHRARRKLAFEWFDHPVCLCGCEGPLARIKLTRKQHCFLQGHACRLEILAAQVVRGEASPDEIPDVTKSLSGFIPFLKRRPELWKAFE